VIEKCRSAKSDDPHSAHVFNHLSRFSQILPKLALRQLMQRPVEVTMTCQFMPRLGNFSNERRFSLRDLAQYEECSSTLVSLKQFQHATGATPNSRWNEWPRGTRNARCKRLNLKIVFQVDAHTVDKDIFLWLSVSPGKVLVRYCGINDVATWVVRN